MYLHIEQKEILMKLINLLAIGFVALILMSPLVAEEISTDVLGKSDTAIEKTCIQDSEPLADQLESEPSNCEAFSSEINCNTNCCSPFFLEHVEGRWLDNSQGYTSVGFFMPFLFPAVSGCYPFLDSRLHVFNDGKTAANLGGGLRMFNCDCTTVFGINAYYDYRKASWNHYFHQVGVGLEVLNDCLNISLNGYIPLGHGAHSKTCFYDLDDGLEASCRQKRRVRPGVDLEIGRWLLDDCSCEYFDLYGAVGFYSYFSHQNQKCQKNTYGGEVRLASNICHCVSLELRGGYDRVNHIQGQVGVMITLPFETGLVRGVDGCCNQSKLCQPVQRQEILYLGKKECCWKKNWDEVTSQN